MCWATKETTSPLLLPLPLESPTSTENLPKTYSNNMWPRGAMLIPVDVDLVLRVPWMYQSQQVIGVTIRPFPFSPSPSIQHLRRSGFQPFPRPPVNNLPNYVGVHFLPSFKHPYDQKGCFIWVPAYMWCPFQTMFTCGFTPDSNCSLTRICPIYKPFGW